MSTVYSYYCLLLMKLWQNRCIFNYYWQFKEATWLRIYNYVKTICGKTKTRDNFNTRQHIHVAPAWIRWWTGITAAVHTKYRHLKNKPAHPTRVSSKQTKKNFGSNRNKPKQDLFRFCFGLFRETKNKKFRFVSVFRTYIETIETNRTVSRQTETNRNNPNFS